MEPCLSRVATALSRKREGLRVLQTNVNIHVYTHIMCPYSLPGRFLTEFDVYGGSFRDATTDWLTTSLTVRHFFYVPFPGYSKNM